MPPAGRYIGSPYDPEARYASGYTVHLTETCDDDTPNLITHVETTTAAVSDDAVTSTIHAALAARDLLPATHIADTGFVNSALFVEARERYGIDLIGPTGRRAGTSNGRPRPAPDSPRAIALSTSPSSGRRVRPDDRVSVGRPRWPGARPQ